MRKFLCLGLAFVLTVCLAGTTAQTNADSSKIDDLKQIYKKRLQTRRSILRKLMRKLQTCQKIFAQRP